MVAVEGGQGIGTIVYMFGGFTFKISNFEMYSSWFAMCSKVSWGQANNVLCVFYVNEWGSNSALA